MADGPEHAGSSSIQKDSEIDTTESETTGSHDTATIPEFIDTEDLSVRVRHYLKANQIKWGVFSKRVLGMTQGRLSVLIGYPRPWEELTFRAKSIYARMEFWMHFRQQSLCQDEGGENQ